MGQGGEASQGQAEEIVAATPRAEWNDEMKIRPVKGTRDFYPDAMRLRNWITDAWRRVSLRNGFEEYDSPIFEYLDLFTAKSGEEIAGQLFSLTDRGGRNLAIRPEITPSLARMVNAKINALPRPVKWFSIPRVCRAENPQKGRLREFFQWNIDVIGTDAILADAECIFVCVDFLRELGLGADDVSVRIGSRALTVAALEAMGIRGAAIDPVLPILDKRPKVNEEEFLRLAREAGLDDEQIAAIGRFQDAQDVESAVEAAGSGPEATKAGADLAELLQTLARLGVSDCCRLDLGIVRGLAYYTGIVYEVFDSENSLRALAGGGRYDNLLEILGGPKVGATGFGMGDVVLGILLEEKGKVPQAARSQSLDFFVIDGDEGAWDATIEVVGALRARGLAADFSYARRSVGKQLKDANRRGARRAAIVRADGVSVKDMGSGEQIDMTLDTFLKTPTG
jgi:histidyl-tRNA synthetase